MAKKQAETIYAATEEIMAAHKGIKPREISTRLYKEYGMDVSIKTVQNYKALIANGKTSHGRDYKPTVTPEPEKVTETVTETVKEPVVPSVKEPVTLPSVNLNQVKRVKEFATKLGGLNQLSQTWGELRTLVQDVGGEDNLKEIIEVLQ
jgi:hypothetical protein